ncbi:hypothetical protein BO71DRAFT_96010 [Aspergillus ellipticus CBS 707.79]|uniref:Uncharacterized protein n=1 Tax=Aspergillus ellipticus CBS 707.79 TaxID=1448320 RepID=A0A319E2G7_9EURO|nr:hypothetical protein BO71DRAFT_96010 [Aspergillus ellipticus CBS 707.79]
MTVHTAYHLTQGISTYQGQTCRAFDPVLRPCPCPCPCPGPGPGPAYAVRAPSSVSLCARHGWSFNQMAMGPALIKLGALRSESTITPLISIVPVEAHASGVATPCGRTIRHPQAGGPR